MTSADADGLDMVARRIELRRPAACVLLVQRELRETRLPALTRHGPYPGTKTGKRVTARIDDGDLKRAFDGHVGKLGFGSDEGAFLLFKAELVEKWLEETLGWKWNRR